MLCKFFLFITTFFYMFSVHSSEGLQFDFVKKSDLTSPNEEIKKEYGDYSNAGFCQKQRSHFSEFHKVLAAGNEATQSGINSCLTEIKGDPGYKCFSFELETKKREQECHRKKGSDLNSCIDEARAWGDKQLADNECGRKLKWAGNIHMLRMLTESEMEKFCDIKSSSHTVNLWLNSRDGTHKTSQSYNKDFANIHWKYYRCIKQACYDSVKRHYPEYLKAKTESVGKCTSEMVSNYGGCIAETRNNGTVVKHCTYTVPIGLASDDYAIKNTITENDKNLAKRFAGKYINNRTISLGKTPDGKDFNGHAWVISNLDTNGNFVSGHLNISLTGDEVFRYAPQINSKRTIEWSNKSLNQIKWQKVSEEDEKALITEFEASSKITWKFAYDSELGKAIFVIKNKTAKKGTDSSEVVVENAPAKTITENITSSNVTTSEKEEETPEVKVLKREGKPAQVANMVYKGTVYTNNCWLGRHKQTLRNYQVKVDSLATELRDEIDKVGCSKQSNDNCNKEEVITILSDFRKKSNTLTAEIDSWRREGFSDETVECSDDMPNVKAMIKYKIGDE